MSDPKPKPSMFGTLLTRMFGKPKPQKNQDIDADKSFEQQVEDKLMRDAKRSELEAKKRLLEAKITDLSSAYNTSSSAIQQQIRRKVMTLRTQLSVLDTALDQLDAHATLDLMKSVADCTTLDMSDSVITDTARATVSATERTTLLSGYLNTALSASSRGADVVSDESTIAELEDYMNSMSNQHHVTQSPVSSQSDSEELKERLAQLKMGRTPIQPASHYGMHLVH